MKATLARLSICACGFSVLHDDIPLGTEYDVDQSDQDAFTFVCGGCGKPQRITGIYVKQRGHSKGGYLPKQIFKLSL